MPFEKQVCHNSSVSFGLLEFEIYRKVEYEQYILQYHWKKELIQIGSSHMF